MRMIEPSVEVTFFSPDNGLTSEEFIEAAARTCYKSEDQMKPGSYAVLIDKLKKRGHFAMTEFGYAAARIVADRGLTHALVRHRLASFAQESTCHNDYSDGKFGFHITVIEIPGETNPSPALVDYYRDSCVIAEERYFGMLEHGAEPEVARMVLPIGIKAEIVIGANLREWRHIFEMRCAKTAHPIIRGIMLQVLQQFTDQMPALYGDLANKYLPESA